MAAPQLPERPNLEQLKRQAKDLLQVRPREGPRRPRALPRPSGIARLSDPDLARAAIALHDAQSVIAREHGFDSWNALRERVEELTLEFGAAVEQFIEAATGGRRDRAERLLTLHPGIARANFQHGAPARRRPSRRRPAGRRAGALATAPGGPRGWEPLHYVCHSAVGAASGAREAGLVAVARRLMALGADANTRFPWLHHGVRRPVLWGAVCVVRSSPLTRALLDAGADPDDGVTLPLAAGGGDIAALELLLRARRGCESSVGHRRRRAALRDAALGCEAGRRSLAARTRRQPRSGVRGQRRDAAARGRRKLGRRPGGTARESRGADVTRRRADGRAPYAVAELNGNRAVAEWLLAHGAAFDLSDVDRLVAACSRGDRAAAHAMLDRRPDAAGRDRRRTLRRLLPRRRAERRRRA